MVTPVFIYAALKLCQGKDPTSRPKIATGHYIPMLPSQEPLMVCSVKKDSGAISQFNLRGYKGPFAELHWQW